MEWLGRLVGTSYNLAGSVQMHALVPAAKQRDRIFEYRTMVHEGGSAPDDFAPQRTENVVVFVVVGSPIRDPAGITHK